jgi:hypothetical protein
MVIPEQAEFGRIYLDPVWALSHRELEYDHEEFNNPSDTLEWRGLGFTQTRFTGDLYDMRRSEPSWMQQIREQIPMRHWSWSLYRMRSGDVLPEHSDTYSKFRNIYDVSDTNTIRRYVLFMEPWQSGHYFEIDGTPITGWQAGDGVYWHGSTPHLAANLGRTHRYTLQITGVISRENV